MDGVAERIAVSLPKSVIERLEKVRRHLQINRSKLFLFAILNYLDRVIEDDDRKLQKIYREIEETDKELLAHYNSGYKNLPIYESE